MLRRRGGASPWALTGLTLAALAAGCGPAARGPRPLGLARARHGSLPALAAGPRRRRARAGGPRRRAGARRESAWETLGVPGGSTREEIKAAYRRLVVTQHPDKRPNDPRAEARFQEITAAYQALVAAPDAAVADPEDLTGEAREAADKAIREKAAVIAELAKFGITPESVERMPFLITVVAVFGLLYYVAFETRTFEQEFGISFRPSYKPEVERLKRGKEFLKKRGMVPDADAYTEEERAILGDWVFQIEPDRAR